MISSGFTEELRKLLDGDELATSKPLIVGKPSFILSICGADINQDITITKKVIDKAMRPENRDENGRMIGNTGHGLTVEQIIQSLMDLDSPTLIFKGRKEGSLIVITNIEDNKCRNIVIAIEFNREECFNRVNSIRSVYGRDKLDFFIGENIEKGNLLAVNKEKADDLLRSIGKSYPKENTFICFK